MKKLVTYSIVGLFASAMWANPVQDMSMTSDLQNGNGQTKLAVLTGRRVPASDSSPLITNPQGQHTIYGRTSTALYQEWFWVAQGTDKGLAVDFVESDDNHVFMNNPISKWGCDGYLEGTRDGNVVTFKFPQVVYQESNVQGEIYDFPIYLIEYDIEAGGYVVSETQELDFVIEGETMRAANDELGFGLYQDNKDGTFLFSGYGDLNFSYTIHTDEPIAAPEGLDIERWGIITGFSGQIINLAFDDNYVYLQGLYSGMPEAWTKADFDGKRVIISTGQYLGIDPTTRHFAYIITSKQEEEWREDYEAFVKYEVNSPSLSLDYDKEAKSLTAYDGSLYFYSEKEVELDYNYLDCLMNPKITYMVRDNDALPADPIMIYYCTREEGLSSGILMFMLPSYDINGTLLDPDNLYYRVFVNDDLYTFQPEDYLGLENPMTQVPYYFNLGNATYGDDLFRYHPITGHSFRFYFMYEERIGVQSVYEEGENTIYSNIVWTDGTVDNTTGVSQIEDSEIKEVIFYNLSGMKVNNPESGMYIKQVIYSDGRVNSSKVVIR